MTLAHIRTRVAHILSTAARSAIPSLNVRRLLLVLGFAATLAAPAATAAPTLSASYSISGIESAFPSDHTSTFAGGATGGGELGIWSARVVHQALTGCPFGSRAACAITGGSFTLNSRDDHLAGTFTGGAVKPLRQQSGCGSQTFSVTGTVTTSHGPATLAATLTHFRTRVFGTCVPYFATVTGSLRLA